MVSSCAMALPSALDGGQAEGAHALQQSNRLETGSVLFQWRFGVGLESILDVVWIVVVLCVPGWFLILQGLDLPDPRSLM